MGCGGLIEIIFGFAEVEGNVCAVALSEIIFSNNLFF